MSVEFKTRREAHFQRPVEAARGPTDDLAEGVIERGRRFRASRTAFLMLCEQMIQPAMTEVGQQLSVAMGHGYRVEIDTDRPRITFYIYRQGEPFSSVGAPSIGAFLTLSGGVGWVRRSYTTEGTRLAKQSNSMPLGGLTKLAVIQKLGRWIGDLTGATETEPVAPKRVTTPRKSRPLTRDVR